MVNNEAQSFGEQRLILIRNAIKYTVAICRKQSILQDVSANRHIDYSEIHSVELF